MNEETKYRVETPDEDEQTEKKGFLRPLPQVAEKQSKTGPGGPVTKILGLTMLEKRKDILVLILMPLLAALIDANIFGMIIIHTLPESTIYMFLIPMFASIPIGLMAGRTSHALFGGILAGFFFVLVFLLFLITPAFIAPDLLIGEFFFSGLVISSVYFLFVVFASLLGSLVGAVAREFF
ncbi:MAG: hypothetical protein ACFFEF_04600 [Candidatus Thorarchaeota archaeon]